MNNITVCMAIHYIKTENSSPFQDGGGKKLITSACTSKNLWFRDIVTPSRPQEGHRISYDDMMFIQLK